MRKLHLRSALGALALAALCAACDSKAPATIEAEGPKADSAALGAASPTVAHYLNTANLANAQAAVQVGMAQTAQTTLTVDGGANADAGN